MFRFGPAPHNEPSPNWTHVRREDAFAGTCAGRTETVSASASRAAEATWDAIAPAYERQVPLERAALEAAATLAGARPSDAVLDVATGTGAMLRALARRPGPPREAIGADRSTAMLARVGPLPPGWRLLRADAAALPFGARRFDLVCAAYLLHLLEPDERDRVLGEVRRVLRPGGRLVTVTPVVPRAPAGLVWRGGAALAEAFPRQLGGLRPLDPRAALQRAGFRLLRGRFVPRGYASLVVLAERR